MDLQKYEHAAEAGSLPPNGLSTARESRPFDWGRSLFTPRRRFNPASPELMDQPGLDRASLREELRTLERCNRRLGGHDLALHYVERFVSSTRARSLSILDLGTGVADIPRAIAAWARQRQLPVTITAVDGNAEILRIAGESCQAWPEIRLEQHDLRSLPFAAAGFDLVMCSLALHHFAAADAVTLLRRIHALARGGYIVSDLRRHWLAIGSTELLARLLIRSPIFRHDAAQSCRAAFTVGELEEMAERAGLNHFQIQLHHGVFRMVLEGKK